MILARMQEPIDIALWIVKVAKVHAMRRADRYARWINSILSPVNAERAFIGISLRVNEARIIGTRSNTGLASDAFLFRHQHHLAQLVHMTRTCGTTRHARRVVAMIAAF